MTDGGKPRSGKGKKRKSAAKAAAAKRSPAESTTAKAAPGGAPGSDEPAAPVGFSARDTAADAAPEQSTKKPGGAGVAAMIAAAVAAVAVAGYLGRSAWLPGADGEPAAVAEKPAGADAIADAKSSPPAAAPAAPAPAAAPYADGAALDALAREREQLRAELDRLMARLDGVEKSMDTAKKMIRATAPPADKIAGQSSLQQLSERVGALEKSEAALRELTKRVDRMEKDAAAGGGDSTAAVVLAVAGLGDAVTRGEPYERHLEALAAVAGADPNVKAALTLLAKRAAAGVPTLTHLRDRFDGLAGQVVRAAKARDDDGWMARAADRIASLITLRRVGAAARDDSVDAVVARAEARLRAGDLAGAVKAVETLESNKKAAAAAASWLADAKARVTAERAVASLRVHAVSLLGSAKP